MRVSTTLMGVCVMALMMGSAAGASAAEAEGTPTFAKDVAPIFYDNCVTCHRPNHLAPMSLISYEDARPWARAVKSKVLAGEMPPFFADTSVRAYKNDTSLTQHEIDTIAAWVDGGAPRGNDADLPEVPQFAEGWSIGEPDLIFTMLEPFEVPADGTVPYSYVTVPTNLKQDVWISAYEFVPGDRRVLHHVIAQVMEDDGKPATGEVLLTRDGDRTRAEGATVGGYVPNRLGTVYPAGVASRLPAGADIEAQMHYTTIGKPVTDRSSWGVVLAAEPDSMRRAGGGQVINPMFRIELDNRLLPVFGVSITKTGSPRLALAVLGADMDHFDIKQLFHGTTHVLLVGQPVDLKGVGIEPRTAMHPFFRYERTQQYLMGLKLKLRFGPRLFFFFGF
jgi:mono/diheme cytochrome c family protein